MSNIAIEGLSSGFDTTSLVNAILDVQYRAPIDDIERRIETETEEYNAFQTVNANMLGLDLAVQSLKSPSLFNGRDARSSNESIATASASNSAREGTFTIQVDNLARADQISSDVFSNADAELGLTGEFMVNGTVIEVSASDTLRTIASQISSSAQGVNAQVLETSGSQNRLVMTASDTGVNQLDIRNIGAANLTQALGLTENNFDVDYTVNANNQGAISSQFGLADTFDLTGRSITINDAGGQSSIDVNFSGVLTLAQIANEINAANDAQDGNINASVFDDGGQQRLLITSDTGIPSQFEDPDNVLYELGVTGGVQSAGFLSASLPIADLINSDASGPATFRIGNGDGSDFRDITVDLSTDSLQDIAQKINDAASPPPVGSDVSAQVITQGGVSRLEISSASGNPEFLNDPDNVLSTLGVVDFNYKNFDQQGENAQFRYNGVTVNRTENVVKDLVEGVTFQLNSESSASTTISITNNTSGVADTVRSFVDAYNKVMEFNNEVTRFNPNEGNGILFGDDTIRRLESDLASMMSTTVPDLPSMRVSELNEGDGIDLGKIRITDREGNSAEVDLGNVRTVKDILSEINNTEGISVEATVNSRGNSLVLRDTSGGVGAFEIADVDGTTAEDLGITTRRFSDTYTGSIIADSSLTSIGMIGIQLQSNGMLTFDESRLNQMLNEDPDRVKNLLSARDIGFGSQFYQKTQQYTQYNTGILDSTSDAIVKNIENFNDQIERIEGRASQYEETLRRQFTALEVTMSQSQQLGQFLSQQLGGNGSG